MAAHPHTGTLQREKGKQRVSPLPAGVFTFRHRRSRHTNPTQWATTPRGPGLDSKTSLENLQELTFVILRDPP